MSWLTNFVVSALLSVQAIFGATPWVSLPNIEIVEDPGLSKSYLNMPGPSESLGSSSQGADKISKGIYAAIHKTSNGMVRIIVDSQVPAVCKTIGTPSEDLTGCINANRILQEAIITQYFGSMAGIEKQRGTVRVFSISSGFALDATLAEIEALAMDDRVLSIHPDLVTTLN